MVNYIRLLFCVVMGLMTSCSHSANENTVSLRTASKHRTVHKKPVHKKSTTHPTIPTIVIDPGHGGYDMGASTRYCEEKDACLRTGLMLRKMLETMGYKVIMTRSRDEFVPLKKRADIANKNRSQLLISLHFNAAKNESASGIEVFYASKAEPWRLQKSKQLAQMVLAKMLSHTGGVSRGVKAGNFCVIRDTHMPSILVEGGFMTNDEELKKISDDRHLTKIAEAIADAVNVYFET